MSVKNKVDDDSESFEDSFSDDEDRGHCPYDEGLGLAHVRRLEQENELSRANIATIELKLIGNNTKCGATLE